MNHYYYKTDKVTDINTVSVKRKDEQSVQDQLRRFHHLCMKADRDARRYAMRYGATNWIEPIQFFTGGVEYLQFEDEPDARIWRRKDFEGLEYPVYEPNVMRDTLCAMYADQNRRPSDTSSDIFLRRWLTWEEVKGKFTKEYWEVRIPVHFDSSNAQDQLDAYMADKHFMLYHHFTANRGKTGADHRAARLAIRAEIEREKLPVADATMFYAIMKADLQHQRNLRMPRFLIYEDCYYIASPYPCRHPKLTEITEANFRTACDLSAIKR